MNQEHRQDERGAAAIEAVVVAPAVVTAFCLVIVGGQLAIAHQSVQAIATDTARAASLARTRAEAQRAAEAALAASLDQRLTCTSHHLQLDLTAFGKRPGESATVAATVVCDVPTGDFGLPLPGTITVEATMSSPLDTYRERK